MKKCQTISQTVSAPLKGNANISAFTYTVFLLYIQLRAVAITQRSSTNCPFDTCQHVSSPATPTMTNHNQSPAPLSKAAQRRAKKHKIGLMIHPPPWVGRERIVSTDENGEEFFEYGKRVKSVDGNEVVWYATGHVSLFFIVAAEPGKSGKTLAIWDADTEGEVRRKLELRKLTEPLQAKEGYSGIQYHLYKHLQGNKGNSLAAWYVGGGGNEGKLNCGPLAVDTLLWWVRGNAGELSSDYVLFLELLSP
jgi:hypothetical protein